MVYGKKVVVVLPAFNAERTLRKTYEELPYEVVDETILIDDASTDETVRVAKDIKIKTIIHESNQGYGANQKTCYKAALESGGDIIVMLHPDYQYPPKLVVPMAYMLGSGEYDVVIGSRILGGKSLEGGMPVYKYVANRVLTFIQNLATGSKLSEYHTGYRAYTKEVLEAIPFLENSDDFIFDNEMLSQILYKGFNVGEISCPTRYFAEGSSINFSRSVRYGLGCIRVSIQYRLSKWGLFKFRLFRS